MKKIKYEQPPCDEILIIKVGDLIKYHGVPYEVKSLHAHGVTVNIGGSDHLVYCNDIEDVIKREEVNTNG